MKKIKDRSFFYRLDAGFTLLEVTIAMLIGGIALLGTSQLMFNISNSVKTEKTMIENLADDILIQKQLSQDLQLSSPSFNNLINIPADSKSKITHEFFEYQSDMKCLEDCERVLTLSLNSTNSATEIYFLTEDVKDQDVTLYPPAKAYKIVKKPTVPAIPPGSPIGTLEFFGLNYDGFLDRVHPGLWENGNLLMLYSMVEVRDENTQLTSPIKIDFTNPGKKLILVGKVYKNSFSTVALDNKLRGLPKELQNGMDPTDAFFRGLPPAGGQAVFAFVQKVKFIKLKIEKVKLDNNRETGKLVRYDYKVDTNGNFEFQKTGVTLAQGLSSVVFRRENISMPTIEFTINWDTSASGSASSSGTSSGGGK
jgi:prepilin-type N-terminal cleavage/methylation domain-containing protein